MCLSNQWTCNIPTKNGESTTSFGKRDKTENWFFPHAHFLFYIQQNGKNKLCFETYTACVKLYFPYVTGRWILFFFQALVNPIVNIGSLGITNPCTAQNIQAGRIFFGLQADNTKFIECDQIGNARVLTCASQMVWDQNRQSCVFPLQSGVLIQPGTTGTGAGTPTGKYKSYSMRSRWIDNRLSKASHLKSKDNFN